MVSKDYGAKEEKRKEEKRKEIEEKRNKDESSLHEKALELCKYYEELKPMQNITQHLAELKIFIDMYGYEWTKEALQKTIANKDKFIQPYMEKILKNWQSEGKPESRKGAKEDESIKRSDEGDNLREQGIGL